jgi:preprotein translocase subunit SecA
MRRLERVWMLSVIDRLWIQHLTAIDDLREGIGLRAYGQRDPLIEYKVEAANMFDALQESIRNEVVFTIYHLQVQQQAPPPPPRGVESGPESGDGLGTDGVPAPRAGAPAQAANGAMRAAAQAGRQPVHAATKVGRNDPCPCGSGKKYKRCHGLNTR